MAATTFFVALALPSSALAYGEPDAAGRPSLKERLTIVLTNQARQAPHAWPGWTTTLATSEARPPLSEDKGLAEAARFHADDLASSGTFAHESSDGTPFSRRLARFFDGFGAENILMGADDPRAAITSWMGSDGHRVNILDAGLTHLGAGRSLAGSTAYYVQDFGVIPRSTTPPIPAASIELTRGHATAIATWSNREGQSPRSFRVAFDASCLDLTPIAGPPGNQTFAVELNRPSSCVPVVFHAESLSADGSRYPSTGALLVGDGCPSEFDPSVVTTPCSANRPVIDAEAEGCSVTRSSSSFWVLLLVCARRRVDRTGRAR